MIVTMLAARQAVQDKIENVKQQVGNTVAIAPAGVRGLEGGGNALTADQMSQVATVAHVSAVTQTLNDRLTSETSNLQSGIDPGTLGQRRSGQSGVQIQIAPPEGGPPERGSSQSSGSGTATTTRTFTMPVMVTGVNNVTAATTFGGDSVNWTSGSAFDPTKDEAVAVVGTKIAQKNSLAVGSTFTAYDAAVTVVGIYDAGNDFANNGVYMQLSALQRLSGQTDSITSATATVDSLDNIAQATTDVKTILGAAADVTSSEETADQLVAPLQSVKKISLYSLIGAVAAAAVVILLTMMMIVRERRREIGVMKAIGASSMGIVRQFVVEAVTLTAMGLIIGLGIGIAAAAPVTDSLVSSSVNSSQTTQTPTTRRGPGSINVVRLGDASRQTITNVQASVGTTILAYGVGAALAIAVVGSAIPAYLISKIRPAEAMRSE